MSKKSFALRRSIGGSETTILKEVLDLRYLDKKVRFSLKSCNIGKFCIRKLENSEIEKLYKRLGYFEELSWQQVKQMPREHGFSIEKRGDGNYPYLASLYPLFDTFLHFRVTGIDTPFRVFGAIKLDLCYLLLIDPGGIVNH